MSRGSGDSGPREDGVQGEDCSWRVVEGEAAQLRWLESRPWCFTGMLGTYWPGQIRRPKPWSQVSGVVLLQMISHDQHRLTESAEVLQIRVLREWLPVRWPILVKPPLRAKAFGVWIKLWVTVD